MMKFMKVIDRGVYFIAGSMLIMASCLLLFSVLYRYVILYLYELSSDSIIIEYIANALSNISVTADEIPGYLLVWVSFLGAYLAIRDNKHIKFDLLLVSVNKRFKNIVEVFVDLLVISFFLILLYYSIIMINIDGETYIETVDIAQGYFMLILPISSVLIIIATLIDIYKRFYE